jgi:C4-dicarboxylate-specific signal transduction histidine kinase
MSITKTKVCNQQKAAFSDDFKRLYIKPMTINYSYRSDFIGLLSAILPPNSEIQAELNDITDAVSTVARRSESLMQFVSSYRRLSSLPEPQKEPVTLHPIFEQTLLLAKQHTLDVNTEIVLKVIPESLMVNVDKNMLEQVLLNLLLNASQAIQGIDNPKVILSAALNKRGHVIIQISDNGIGIGIDKALKSKIFVPFYTTKREGSGVGLALTRQVMIAHGGSVTVKNNQAGGATFTLNF